MLHLLSQVVCLFFSFIIKTHIVMRPWRCHWTSTCWFFVMVAITKQQDDSNIDGGKNCMATASPMVGDPAQVTCLFPVDVTSAIPVSITVERYRWFPDISTEEVLECLWTKPDDRDCKLKPGYSSGGPVGTQMVVNITAMSTEQAGEYACKMMSLSLPTPFQQTCVLTLPGTPDRPRATPSPDSEGGVTEETSEAGTGPIALIAGLVAAAVVVGVAVVVIICCLRRCRRKSAEAKENRVAEDWIEEDDDQPSSCRLLCGWLTSCRCRKRTEEQEAGTVKGVENGLVKSRIQRFDEHAPTDVKAGKPLVKQASSSKSTKSKLFSRRSDSQSSNPSAHAKRPIYTKVNKTQPAVPATKAQKDAKKSTGGEELPLKPQRNISANEASKDGRQKGKVSDGQGAKQSGVKGKSTRLSDIKESARPETLDPSAPYRPVEFATSPEEFVEIFMEQKSKLKPTPVIEAPDEISSGKTRDKRHRDPSAIEFENEILKGKKRLASRSAVPDTNDRIEEPVAPAKEYEKELAAQREGLKSSQSSEPDGPKPASGKGGKQPAPAGRSRFPSREGDQDDVFGPDIDVVDSEQLAKLKEGLLPPARRPSAQESVKSGQ